MYTKYKTIKTFNVSDKTFKECVSKFVIRNDLV